MKLKKDKKGRENCRSPHGREHRKRLRDWKERQDNNEDEIENKVVKGKKERRRERDMEGKRKESEKV